MNKTVVLASGGLDSTTLCYWYLSRGDDVVPMFVDYGQHAAKVEIETVRSLLPIRLLSRLNIVRLSGVFDSSPSRLISEPNLWTDEVESSDLHLPYRNALLLSLGVAFAGSIDAKILGAGFINSNHALEPDATAAFLNSWSELSAQLSRVRVEFPFRNMSKSEVARVGVDLGVPVAETFSCQVNSRAHCGACPNCVDRLSALAALRL